MMHFLVILNSQLVMHLYMAIHKVHLSMLKICQLLIGKDRKKSHKKKNQKCRLIQKTQEILSKAFLVLMTAGSLDPF